jgi:2-oxoisovalerate dehydrogenase E1 component beta subunit
VPEGYYTVPMGKAEIVREGERPDHRDLRNHGACLRGCGCRLGLDAEVIDVRTMMPLDVETLVTSVKKTGRCVVVHEATRFCGYGGELSATIQEECFWHLQAPILRVAGWDTPVSPRLRVGVFPGQQRVARALTAVMEAR